MLKCNNCAAEAQLDAATRQVRYTAIPKAYAQFEGALKDKWLTRRETFELTELKPLPTVVFFPIIISLVALCALFGLIGIVLAVRPGMGATRQIIDDAYARQNVQDGVNLPVASPLATPLTPTLTTTAEISLTPGVSGTVEVTSVMVLTPTPESGLTPTAPPAAPPAAPATPTPTLPPPNIPTRPPTFTPVPPPPSAPTVPAVPTPIPTATPVQSSPLATPLATNTPTATPVPGQAATLTPTPTGTGTSTATPSAPQNGAVLITGTVAISNVLFQGTTTFNEVDEYIDLFNRGTVGVPLSGFKLRVGQGLYALPAGLQVLAGQGCRIYTGLGNNVDAPAPFNSCGSRQSFNINGNPTGIWPNSPGTRVELLDAANVVVAYFSY